MEQQPRKRILYFDPSVFDSEIHPKGRTFSIDGVEVLCAHNSWVAEEMLMKGPYDLIGVHHDCVATYQFAEGARARYRDTLIIGLCGAVKRNWKDTIEKGLGKEREVFDDIIYRQCFEFKKNLSNLIKLLNGIEAKQKAAGVI